MDLRKCLKVAIWNALMLNNNFCVTLTEKCKLGFHFQFWHVFIFVSGEMKLAEGIVKDFNM